MVDIVRDVEFDSEHQAKSALDRGDSTRALEILMNVYGNAVYRYCCRMMRDAELAKDVLQTTFLQAFKDCQSFRDKSSIRTWLFGIAYHRCLDAMKSRRRKDHRCDPIELVEEPVDTADGPEYTTTMSEFSSALVACLDELDPQVRAPLLLRFQAECTYPEIAAICRTRAATLQARVARAMPLLRQCLERKGVRR